ncbi:MAG: alkaline phosphatase, partial [Bacteroidota bacterium]
MKQLTPLIILFLLIGCHSEPRMANSQAKVAKVSRSKLKNENSSKTPKNIILMVGDGMGISQITAGLYANGNQLHLERFPVIGLHKSYASDNLVTDSAAGATAFSIGEKTYNGAIGVLPDTSARQTILELAASKGLATGLIATSEITHATPASFIAHQPSRQMHEAIAADFLNTDIDLFIGGGKKYFDDREEDNRDLVQELEAKGYSIQSFIEAKIEDVNMEVEKLAYFTANVKPLPAAQGREYLPYASNAAVSFLNN